MEYRFLPTAGVLVLSVALLAGVGRAQSLVLPLPPTPPGPP